MWHLETMGIRTIEDAAMLFTRETKENYGRATKITLVFISCGARITHLQALELVEKYGLPPDKDGFEQAIKRYYSKHPD